jgi:glycerophosphoryl diester phosphodiesterase
MTPTRRDVSLLTLAAALAPAAARADVRTPVIIAHVGPRSPTRAAFDQLITEGADFLETGVVVSQDGVLIALPDHELSIITDIAGRPEFAARRATKTVDGTPINGWFAEDFTLAELKTLHLGAATQRPHRAGPGVAPSALLSLQDVVDVARAGCVREARVIGVSPRITRPAYFAGAGLPIEARLADLVRANGYNSPAAAMLVQAHESAALQALGPPCRVRRLKILDGSDAPADEALARFAEATSPAGLAKIRAYAEAVVAADGLLVSPSGPGVADPGMAGRAHAAGLQAFVRSSGARERLTAIVGTGFDGLITVDVAQAIRARDDAMNIMRKLERPPSH